MIINPNYLNQMENGMLKIVRILLLKQVTKDCELNRVPHFKEQTNHFIIELFRKKKNILATL